MSNTGGQPVARLTTALVGHFQNHPFLSPELIRPPRFLSLASAVAVSGSFLNLDNAIIVADVVALIFCIDDLVDEGNLPIEEVERRFAVLSQGVAGDGIVQSFGDPIAECLASVAQRLRNSPFGAHLSATWQAGLRRMLTAMLEERRADLVYAAGGPAPSLGDYLQRGIDTLGFGIVVLAAWMVIGEEAMSDNLTALDAAKAHFACATRMANDLSSAEREMTEGKVNSLTILGPGGGEILRLLIRRELTLGGDILRCLPKGLNRSSEFLSTCAHYIIGMYEHCDFHTFDANCPHWNSFDVLHEVLPRLNCPTSSSELQGEPNR